MAAFRSVEHIIRPRLPAQSTTVLITAASCSASVFSSGARNLSCRCTTGRGNKDGVSTRSTHLKEARRSSRVTRRTRSDLEFLLDNSHSGDFLLEDDDFNHHHQQHVPVMLGEVLRVFRHRQIRSFVDCTIGAGGHSSAMMRSHPEMKILIGLDVDPRALDASRSRLERQQLGGDLKFHTFLSNFKRIKSVLGAVKDESAVLLADGVDGILMDLGMSSMQVNNPERGFSILADGPLDMRMDPQVSLTAADILNSWPEDEIGRILREYGEESNWRMLQRKIINARVRGGLHSTLDLANLIRTMPLHSGGRHGWLKTATRVFQALRIAVNDELKTLKIALYACFDCLSPGGRFAVLSFHSLEDRIVKQAFLDIVGLVTEDDDAERASKLKEDVVDFPEEEWAKGKKFGKNGVILTKRPITPSEGEEKLNTRCRSAKLRVLQKF